MNDNTPAHQLLRIKFCTLAGAERVLLEGAEISGKWDPISNPGFLCGPTRRRLSEDFANWSTEPSEILRFTKKYGPLRLDLQRSKRFEFSLKAWRTEQRNFRDCWEGLSPQLRRYGGLSTFGKTFHGWSFSRGELTYTAADLGEFLYLDLFSCPAERLRKCVRPDCKNPYFIARHLKQKYCNDSCANWAQGVWKKQWWQKQGKKWRAKKVSRLPKGR
jgi:hypothetical protein